ncbi:MAG: hypothetical protein Tsb0020_29050 [Haliangiales bacterium]
MVRIGQPDITSESPAARSRAQERARPAGVPESIAEEIARSRAYLEAGEIAQARDAYLRGRALSMQGALLQASVSDLVELCSLDGEICEREGRPEAAVRAYRVAHSLAPHSADHLIDAIEVVLEEDPVAAIAMCHEASVLAQDDGDRLHLILLEAEAHIERGARLADDDAAASEAPRVASGVERGVGRDGVDREPPELDAATRDAVCQLLARLDHFIIDEPEVWAHIGDMYRVVGEHALAEHVYLTALTLDDECAEVHFGLGYLYEALGDDERMIEAWLAVRDLDLSDPPDTLELSDHEWEQTVRRTLAELPVELQLRLADVTVEIASVPPVELIAEGVHPRLFGWLSGRSGDGDSGPVSGDGDGPVIYLFTHALTRAHRDRHELAAAIRATVCREAAYFLDISEDDLAATRLD